MVYGYTVAGKAGNVFVNLIVEMCIRDSHNTPCKVHKSVGSVFLHSRACLRYEAGEYEAAQWNASSRLSLIHISSLISNDLGLKATATLPYSTELTYGKDVTVEYAKYIKGISSRDSEYSEMCIRDRVVESARSSNLTPFSVMNVPAKE